MQKLGLYALGALVFLAGCNKAPTPSAAPPPAPIANSVSGTVALKDPHELSDDAKIDLKVVDVTQTATPVAQTTIPNANHPPVSFNLPIDPHAIDPKRTYSLEVVLTDGERRYLPVLQYPVLTNKAPSSNIAVVVAPEPTPGEKLYEAFNRAYGQVGSMIHFNGSSQDESSSTAWDAFASNGKVKFVREITDLDNDKGRISTRIAYKDDKPWVVVREESSRREREAVDDHARGLGRQRQSRAEGQDLRRPDLGSFRRRSQAAFRSRDESIRHDQQPRAEGALIFRSKTGGAKPPVFSGGVTPLEMHQQQ